VGFGEGALWAANGTLVRIDPDNGRELTLHGGDGATALTFDQGLWTAHVNGTATRLDPRSGQVSAVVRVSSAPLTAIAAQENLPSVWALSPATDSLEEISPTKQRVIATITFDATPTGLAVTPDGSAWVTTAAGQLQRVR
jgi:streptogramin lyase